MIRRIAQLVFVLVLVAIAFFAMRPAWVNAGRTMGLPPPLAHWLNQHDRLSNFLAFAALGALAVLLPLRSRPGADGWTMFSLLWNSVTGRLVILAGFVMTLEVCQIWIPGRIFDLMDVLCGWGGLLVVWILWQLVIRIAPRRF